MALAFKKIGVIARSSDESIGETLAAVLQYCRAQHVQVFTDEHSLERCKQGCESATIVPKETLAEKCDLLICVGGDGNLLHASKLAIEHGTPVIGVNKGRLGFLTDIKPDQLTQIGEVLAGHYQLEARAVLHAKIQRDGATIQEETALNDAVLHPGKVAHMIEFEIYINGDFVCSQRADGLIIATPTGSTAYALSGGGPIIHPTLNVHLLVPMFPHTLSHRPLVIDNEDEIELVLTQRKGKTRARFSCDGSPEIALRPHDRIQIRKYPKPLQLLHPNDYHYYETLRQKLHWGTKLETTS